MRIVRFLTLTFLCLPALQAERKPLPPPESQAPVSVPRRMTLEQAYERALATDQSIELAWQEVLRAELLPGRALARMTPRLNGSMGASRSGSERSGDSSWSESSSARARLSISQPLVDFSVAPAYRAGKLSALESKADYRDAVRDTLLGVATAYYDVLERQALVSVNEETLRLAEQQLTLAQGRVDAGEAVRTDSLRAQVTVQRAKRALTESQNALRLARTVLGNALNLGPGAEFEAVEPAPWTADSRTVDDARRTARENRDDLRRAALTVQRRKENLAEVRGNYLPTLSADAGVGRDVSDSRDSSDRSNDYSAGLSLSIPFFSGGQKQLDLRAARADIAQAELEYQQRLKAADEEVTQAWLETRTLKTTLEGLKVEVTSAAENHELLRQQYQEGEVISLDVLQALTDLAVSRSDLTVSTYQYQLALRRLAARTALLEPALVERASARFGPAKP